MKQRKNIPNDWDDFMWDYCRADKFKNVEIASLGTLDYDDALKLTEFELYPFCFTKEEAACGFVLSKVE